jgi:hypothetical protein
MAPKRHHQRERELVASHRAAGRLSGVAKPADRGVARDRFRCAGHGRVVARLSRAPAVARGAAIRAAQIAAARTIA